MKPSVPSVKLLAFALALPACGDPPAFVDVHLTARHPRPAEAREVWSTRFRNARDRELLAITRAEARLEAPGLVLDARVRVPACDAATAAATRLALADLTTGQHTLALHRVAPAAAEALAERVRERLGVDVHTPSDRKGQLVVAAPADRVLALATDEARVVVERAGDRASLLWAIEPAPALTGASVASAGADVGADHAALELTFDDAGARVLSAVSEASRGEPLVFLIDDTFALAPTVAVRVSHTMRLELPPGQATRARELARAIAASNLAEPPVLVSADARCAAP